MWVKGPAQLYALGLVLPVYDLPVHRHLFADTGPDYTIESDPHPELLTPCWIWQKKTHRGHGMVRNGHHRDDLQSHSNRPAHRLYYELVFGAVPLCEEGFQQDLDHLCRRKDCVNPAHLRPMIPREHGYYERMRQAGAPHDDDEVPF